MYINIQQTEGVWLAGKREVGKGWVCEGERSIKSSRLGRSSCLHPNCWPICFCHLIWHGSLERRARRGVQLGSYNGGGSHFTLLGSKKIHYICDRQLGVSEVEELQTVTWEAARPAGPQGCAISLLLLESRAVSLLLQGISFSCTNPFTGTQATSKSH